MIGRDHRAVVIRCTATNITPADEIDVKYSQLTRRACHPRSGCTNRPITKTTSPKTARARDIVLRLAGVGRSSPATTSSLVGTCTSCAVIGLSSLVHCLLLPSPWPNPISLLLRGEESYRVPSPRYVPRYPTAARAA